MKRPTLLLLSILSICSQLSFDAWDTSAQGTSATGLHRTHWTAADEKDLLAKAREGNREAQFWLGTAYEQGFLGSPDFRESLKWFRKAAAHGDPDAQNALGQMYENGEGVSADCTLAAKWYLKAANHVPNLGGAGQGRNNLGLLYLDGRGVPKDFINAYMWFRLADVAPNLAIARAQLTSAQVEKAERMVLKWRRDHRQL